MVLLGASDLFAKNCNVEKLTVSLKLSDLTSGRTYPFGDTGLTVYSSPFSEAGNRECDFTYHFR